MQVQQIPLTKVQQQKPPLVEKQVKRPQSSKPSQKKMALDVSKAQKRPASPAPASCKYPSLPHL